LEYQPSGLRIMIGVACALIKEPGAKRDEPEFEKIGTKIGPRQRESLFLAYFKRD
jgi:hypothetical protein